MVTQNIFLNILYRLYFLEVSDNPRNYPSTGGLDKTSNADFKNKSEDNNDEKKELETIFYGILKPMLT